jgi:hypothetical protein
MPSSALSESELLIYAENLKFQINEKRPRYSCPECSKRMIFVDGTKYVKHFRHYRLSDCEFEAEPETEEHLYAKRVVEAILGSFKKEDPTLLFSREYQIIDAETDMSKYADVYCESKISKKRVVIEIQQTNYNITHFLDKILFYYYSRYDVIYLFIGNQFGKPLEKSSKIYSLKEIENKIFQEKSLPVWGAYLFYDNKKIPFIEIPSYRPKFKRGAYSYLDFTDKYCKTRFIKEFNPERLRLKDWLYKILYEYDHKYVNSKLCDCKRTVYVKSKKKIIRYKEICVYCKKTLRWIPNSEAKIKGLEI